MATLTTSRICRQALALIRLRSPHRFSLRLSATRSRLSRTGPNQANARRSPGAGDMTRRMTIEYLGQPGGRPDSRRYRNESNRCILD